MGNWRCFWLSNNQRRRGSFLGKKKKKNKSKLKIFKIRLCCAACSPRKGPSLATSIGHNLLPCWFPLSPPNLSHSATCPNSAQEGSEIAFFKKKKKKFICFSWPIPGVFWQSAATVCAPNFVKKMVHFLPAEQCLFLLRRRGGLKN